MRDNEFYEVREARAGLMMLDEPPTLRADAPTFREKQQERRKKRAKLNAISHSGALAMSAVAVATILASAPAPVVAMPETVPVAQIELPLITETTMYQAGVYLVGHIDNPADATGIESYELCLQSTENPEKNISRNIKVDGEGDGYFSFQALSSAEGTVVYDMVKVYTKPISEVYKQVVSEIDILPITISCGTIDANSLTYDLETQDLTATSCAITNGTGAANYMGSELYSGVAGGYNLIDEIDRTYAPNVYASYTTNLTQYDASIKDAISAGVLVAVDSNLRDEFDATNPATTAISGAYYVSDYIEVVRVGTPAT